MLKIIMIMMMMTMMMMMMTMRQNPAAWERKYHNGVDAGDTSPANFAGDLHTLALRVAF